MPRWMPDWQAMLAAAPHIPVEGPGDAAYLVADAHLGSGQSTAAEFIAMLELLERPRMLVFLGDLFTVWLAAPKYWDEPTRQVLQAFARLRQRGVPIVFVVGNREFLLPRGPHALASSGLPFDAVLPGAGVLTWAGRRYGITHGDVVNRADAQYLKWRWIARSLPFELMFRAMPGGWARKISLKLERGLATTNQEIKIQYPAQELRAFAQAALPGLDGYFIGHFHRDEVVRVPGQDATLRIVPDWFSRKRLLRLEAGGQATLLRLESKGGPRLVPA